MLQDAFKEKSTIDGAAFLGAFKNGKKISLKINAGNCTAKSLDLKAQ